MEMVLLGAEEKVLPAFSVSALRARLYAWLGGGYMSVDNITFDSGMQKKPNAKNELLDAMLEIAKNGNFSDSQKFQSRAELNTRNVVWKNREKSKAEFWIQHFCIQKPESECKIRHPNRNSRNILGNLVGHLGFC